MVTASMSHSTPLSPTATELQTLLLQASGGMHDAHAISACCCGQDQCAYLERNDAVLNSLEHDLQSAAEIGQVCLQLVALSLRDDVADIRSTGSARPS